MEDEEVVSGFEESLARVDGIDSILKEIYMDDDLSELYGRDYIRHIRDQFDVVHGYLEGMQTDLEESIE